MALSPYYVASNKGYFAAKKLTEYLESLGADATHDTEMNAKKAALKTGGHIGRNGFYYHSEFGSLVNIQTIVTDCIEPDEPRKGETKCLECGACVQACPSGGVGNLRNCLRSYSNALVPEHLRGDLYQLLGCESCQTACPQNSKEQKQTPQFCTSELLAGKHTKELRAIAGANMARTNRILSQAAIYAANTGQTSQIGQLQKLTQTAMSPIKEHALWAIKKLEESCYD